MAAVAGIVKSVSSDVIAIDQNDHVRVLDVNDKVYIGEAIKGESESASITITANDGQDISINGYDTLWLDSSVVSDDIGESSIDTDALFKALLGNDYVSILDHINEKVDDILSATNLEQEEPNDEASVNISFNEIDPNLANEHGLREDDLLAKMNEHKESDKQIDPSFEHTNLNATTIYIDIDNDLNKLS
ncbi:hypothetical protein [Campylobacter concisus]|jgi:hypothetical protein